MIVAVIVGRRWSRGGWRAPFLSLRYNDSWTRAGSAHRRPQVLGVNLPNSMGPSVAGTIDVGGASSPSLAVLPRARLPLRIPTWGRIPCSKQPVLAPHWALFPGPRLFLTVLSINYIGDGLLDALASAKVL